MRPTTRRAACAGAVVAAALALGAFIIACGSFAETGSGSPLPDGSGGADGAADADLPDGSSDLDGPASRYRSAVMADDPVAYWRLGVPVAPGLCSDERGNHAGTFVPSSAIIFAATGALARDPDTAAKFDGDGRITVGDEFDFANNVAFSIELWVKPATIPAGAVAYRWLISKQSGAGGYMLQMAPDGALGFRVIGAGVDGGADDDTLFAPLVHDAFTHVVASYDSTGTHLFLNAVPVGNKQGIVILPDTTANLTIGGASFATAESDARATLDEVALYAKALSLSQVQAHYSAAF